MSTANRPPNMFISSPLSTPVPILDSPGSSSTIPSALQPRLRAPKRTEWDKTDDILKTIQKDFGSLGDFLACLFHHHSLRGDNDPRTRKHVGMVTAFLQGSSGTHMGEIIELVYNHRQSCPPRNSSDAGHAFSPTIPLNEISHARPCLSAWATRVVGDEVYREVGKMTKNDPMDLEDRTQLRATRSSRSRTSVPQVTWEDLGKFSIPALAKKYQKRGPLAWFLAESMAAPRRNGAVIVRTRRPHTTIAVGAISAFVFARNRFANYLALNIGVWQFACKAHIDEKRVFSRFGYAVHDTTIRECLNALSDSSLAALRKSVAEGIAEGTLNWKYSLDNVQRWFAQREHRIGRQAHMKIGCAATAIKLEDCAPGAFDLADHLERVMKGDREGLTAASIYDSIDWSHQDDVQALHWVRLLVGFIDHLENYRREVSATFRGPEIAKHRMREGRKTVVQPLGTNGEKEVETQGMMRAILDFEQQMGLDEKALEGKIVMPAGDRASFAAILRIKKYMAAHPSDYKAFRGHVSVPEIWHTRATNLNSIVENHYGPIASPDPSSLSKSAAAVNTKRPSNLKSCDFYPTARSVILFFETRVLDCWRVYFDVDDLEEHFSKLKAEDKLPTFDELRAISRVLVRRYASQEAYEQALSYDEWDSATDAMKIPKGTAWAPPVQAQMGPNTANDSVDDDDEANEGRESQGVMHVEPEPTQIPTTPGEADNLKEATKDKTKVNVEAKVFNGDRCVANEALFLQDAGWWIEASYAVSEGDIGRVYEILKIWSFSFAGTTNHNYSNWLLELYCLIRYESSKDLSDAILNNWLVNLTGELGKWIEADLMQEHYNRWLEDMAEKMGGEFDDKFYRHTLSPNVQHFLRIKEEMESAFELMSRSKTHGSAHLRDEYQSLLRMYKEDELHYFRPGCSMGHVAVNTFNIGYERLEGGRIKTFLKKSLAYTKILRDIKSFNCEEEVEGMAMEVDSQPELGENSDGEGVAGVDDSDNEVEKPDRPVPGQQLFVDMESGSMVVAYGSENENEGESSSEDNADDEEEMGMDSANSSEE